MNSLNCIWRSKMGIIQLENIFTDIFLNWKKIIKTIRHLLVYPSLLTIGQDSHHVYPLTTGQLLFRGKRFAEIGYPT